MKYFLGVIIFLSLSHNAFSKFVNEDQARTVAYHHWQTLNNISGPDALQLVYTGQSTLNNAVITDFYVFGTQNATGFVMVAADDNIIPIIAYSTDNNFIPASMPENLANWLEGYKMQINDVISTNYTATQSVTLKWNNLITGQSQHTAAKTTSYGAIPPLFAVLWGQETYYDSLCPYDNNAGARTITGCVATAMAQVLRYWKWPKTGTGSHSYTPSNAGLGAQTVNFAQQTYLWDSMPNNLSKNNYQVANVMYSCGVSVDMSYGVTASGAYVTKSQSPYQNCTESALPAYFRYSTNIHGEDRGNYTDSQWIQLIYNDLVLRHPIIYSGFGSQGGHCFVLNGCDNFYRFYFNWGWTGNSNGYYTLDALNPGGMDFNSSHAAVFGSYPDTLAPASINNIQTASGQNTIILSPNPANNILQVQASGAIQTILLSDITGKVCLTQNGIASLNTVTVNTANLPAGLYMVQTRCTDFTAYNKVLIAR